VIHENLLPTCNETMQNLGVEGQRIFWCPRCGTLKLYSGEHADVERPAWMTWTAEKVLCEALEEIKRGGKE
jgi:Zn-finger nucleic acid-binding protein